MIPEATAHYLLRHRYVRRTGRGHRTIMLARRGRALVRRIARKAPANLTPAAHAAILRLAFETHHVNIGHAQ